MASHTGDGSASIDGPEQAFAVLGERARFEILQALGAADGPLSYSDLFERIDYEDRSNFGYHLDKLVGHFVHKTDGGYRLGRPGERVLEAVSSGAVTADPKREATRVDRPCPFCGAAIDVGYREERVTLHCPECQGLLGRDAPADQGADTAENLGFRPLPPAAIDGRSATEMHDDSKTWTALTVHAMRRGVCPRCSGRSERSVAVCDAHHAESETCTECGRRFGAVAALTCTNCVFAFQVGVAAFVSTSVEVMGFLTDHGIDPLAPTGFHPYAAVEETIVGTDPFEARYAFTIDDETLTVTVDADLAVVSADRETDPSPPE